MPLTSRLFSKFEDGGWIFSKSIGIFLSGYLMWVLSSIKVLRFTNLNCQIILMICILLNGLLLYLGKKQGNTWMEKLNFRLIVVEELVFLAVFLIWMYIVSFDPAAYGTEKFMDYGFMTTMMRAEYMPPIDTWYSGTSINYYYGGQYLATYLTKVSTVTAGEGYNLMRNTIAACAFAMPFSIVYQLLQNLQLKKVAKISKKISYLGGALSGLAVSVCGNIHYVIYALILPWIAGLQGKTIENGYYYPNSTRYIGHNPEVVGDKTIHEFPSYSFVVGDLHAHMVNIMFTLVVVGIALSWALRMQNKKQSALAWNASAKSIVKEALWQPEIWMIGFFTGMFRWTNFWDFPIYFVVGGCVIFFTNIRLYRKSLKQFAVVTGMQAAFVLIIGYVASLPFTLTFDKIASNIRLTHSHTPLYQLLVLWGLPSIIVLAFIVYIINSYRRKIKDEDLKKGKIVGFFCSLSTEDLFVFLMALCALGLILMPEIIYVEDIYTTSYRANTMFKMTYQGYILFGLCMAYILVRALLYGKRLVRGFAVAGLCCVLVTAGYMANAVNSKFGDIFDVERLKGIDASIYVAESFSTDYEAINWLNENVEGQPVVLEANGDSYSGYERVSVATGLPTVLGWYVHEWLWRGDTEAENIRVADVESMYTSTDKAQVEELIEKYDVSYIYIGTLEREKFENLNDSLLQELGEVVYSNGTDTYIMKVKSDD